MGYSRTHVYAHHAASKHKPFQTGSALLNVGSTTTLAGSSSVETGQTVIRTLMGALHEFVKARLLEV